jgi:hypothetical protein
VSEDSSDCFQYFGYQDFKDLEVDPASLQFPECPIKTCPAMLVKIPYGKSGKWFCPTHGIRLHSNTFVYWNGEAQKDGARLRNFRVLPNLAKDVALHSVGKAESHRLGYEMSEDALTWNFFVGLARSGKLGRAVKFLTGRGLDAEPKLYLWGKLVDIAGARPEFFEPLGEVRRQLECGIGNFKTEPDVMLVSRELIVCVEAKFGSGNTLAHEGQVRVGDKPTDPKGLLARYLDQALPKTKGIIDRKRMSENFHSQLFRNIVFASAMAKDGDWHVVNLVSTTQWKSREDTKYCSFGNPKASIQSYLDKSCRECFSFQTWEGLYGELVKDDAGLGELNIYFRTKSAHYRPAFDLDTPAEI